MYFPTPSHCSCPSPLFYASLLCVLHCHIHLTCAKTLKVSEVVVANSSLMYACFFQVTFVGEGIIAPLAQPSHSLVRQEHI